jgi:hypothetical protein
VEKYGRAGQATDDNIIWRMRFACWITKATDTHSERVILTDFPRQQRLRERASFPILLQIYEALFKKYVPKYNFGILWRVLPDVGEAPRDVY